MQKILKKEFGNEVAIIGKTMGPWTLAYHVFGVETFLLLSIDDPKMTMECLKKLKEISTLFGQAQIDAGADVLIVSKLFFEYCSKVSLLYFGKMTCLSIPMKN